MKKILLAVLLFFPITSFAYTSADLVAPYAHYLSDGRVVSGHSIITRLNSDPSGICLTSWRLKADGDVTWESNFTYSGGHVFFKPDGTQFNVSTTTWFNSFTRDNHGDVKTHVTTKYGGQTYNNPHDIILYCVSQADLNAEFGPSAFDWISFKELADTPTNECANGNLNYTQCRAALGNNYFGAALLNPLWWYSNRAYSLKNDNLAAAIMAVPHTGLPGNMVLAEEGSWEETTGLSNSDYVDYGVDLVKMALGAAIGLLWVLFPVFIAINIILVIIGLVWKAYRFFKH